MSIQVEMDSLMAEVYLPRGPGAVGLIAQRGEIIYERAYGLADLELEVPVRPEMVFPVGSMTKMFVATAAMLLAENSELDYATPVTAYLPECPDQWRAVTVDHLLSHTSGIPDLFSVPNYIAQLRNDVSPPQLTEFVRDLPLLFEPGSRPAYCNTNYVLLGRALEAVTGKPLEQVVCERVISPLGLSHTYFAVDNDQVIPGRVNGYVVQPGGELRNQPFVSWSQAYGAGTVHSTVRDLLRYVVALFQEGFLGTESLKHVTTPRIVGNGERSPYGYGNLFVFAEGCAPLVRISGSTMGHQAYSLYVQERDAYVAILSNTTAHRSPNPYFPGPLVNAVARRIAATGVS